MEIEPIDPAFRRVWSRVNGGSPSIPPFVSFPAPESTAEPAPLSRQLQAERQRRQAYQRMGLAGPAEDCLRRIRLLSTARFFCFDPPFGTGAPLPRLSFPTWCQGVRSLWQMEDAARQDYLTLAQDSESDPLRQTLEQCAGLCQTTRQRLWQMVLNGCSGE